MAKILVLDIETKPAMAFVWGMFRVNIGLEQLISSSEMICVGAKWYGTKDEFFFSEWENGKSEMLEGIHGLISEADAVVTYNGDNFDLRKLRGEFLLAGLPAPPPITSIDVYKAIKKLGFQSGKLAYVGPHLGLGDKIKHEGFTLWKKVFIGDPVAQRQMEKYCMQDVRLLEKLYHKVRGYISNHPHMGETSSANCGACGSTRVQSRGFRRTKAYKIQRLHCQSCGSWQDGKRTKA